MGYDRRHLDPTTRPQDDFNQYAVGGYLAQQPIPDDRASWGIIEEVAERNFHLLHDILQETDPHAPPGSVDQKLHDFYASGMDQATIDAAGIEPLRELFDYIEQSEDLVACIAWLHTQGVFVVFDFGSGADADNPATNIGQAFQGGLGLPDRDYYLDDDKAAIRTAYVEHLGRMFELCGDDRTKAQTVMAIETRLARISIDKVELRDPQAIHNPRDLDQLAVMMPRFDWPRYFAGLGLPAVHRINVGTPSFFEQLDGFDISDCKAYFKAHVLGHCAPFLSQPFEQEDFDFHGRVMTGVDQQLPRWRRVVADIDASLGEALGRKYVERAFPPEAKAAAIALVEGIRAAAADAIRDCPWMTDSTRVAAQQKLDAMVLKIGYPDTWKDYAALDIKPGPYIENMLRAWVFETREDLDKIDRPVDRTLWGMSPPTVNAYYDDTANEFVFPAGILQPPLFDVHAELEANLGATGATVGHELTHAFDDEGAHYDWQGRLHDWWTPEDLAHFHAIGDAVSAQMSEFEFEGVHEDGELVCGESIADLGGLELAWRAFQKLSNDPSDVPAEDGFTPAQRFFLHYAFSWATQQRPEYARLRLTTDEHPLPAFRVNAPLANLPAFWAAFNVQPGDALRRPHPTRLWG